VQPAPGERSFLYTAVTNISACAYELTTYEKQTSGMLFATVYVARITELTPGAGQHGITFFSGKGGHVDDPDDLLFHMWSADIYCILDPDSDSYHG